MNSSTRRRADDQPIVAGSSLTARVCLALFDVQLGSRHLDLAARWLRAQGRGYYTIGSSGHEGNAAVRVGDWKLVRFHRRGAWELYNVVQDRTELHDRAAAEPDRVKDLAARYGKPVPAVSDEVRRSFSHYPWPGNVRELEHVIEQMVVTTPGETISAENVPPHLTSTRAEPFLLDFDPSRPLQDITDELTERIERAYLKRNKDINIKQYCRPTTVGITRK